MLKIKIVPLVPNAVLPKPAPAKGRQEIPPGYGVQEQCLPFTAATALGFLVLSPIAFGLCPLDDVPPDGHAFRSPLDWPGRSGTFTDERVFYVKDAPHCRFVKNAFTFEAIEIVGDSGEEGYFEPVQPGLSFFDREDQLDLFKIHLPYIWRTPPDVDTLFLPAINRKTLGLTLMVGLVETDWYTNPVNLVFSKPPAGESIHVDMGAPIAQVIFLPRSHRQAILNVLEPQARAAHNMRAGLWKWYQQHAKKRNAYKILARSRHGRI